MAVSHLARDRRRYRNWDRVSAVIPFSGANVIASLTRAWKRLGGAGTDALKRAEQDHANVHRRKVERLSRLLVDRPMCAWEVLDIGCGYHFPQVALFHGRVARIEGLDITSHFFRDPLARQLSRACRNRGLARGLYGTVYNRLYFSQYFRHLQRLAGRAIPIESLFLTSYAGGRFPFSNESFDVVISSAVLEHVMDMDSFAFECARVLKPGGVLDMWWHNWFCPSGSHTEPSERALGPWGHLLGGPAYACLNHFGPERISEAFERHLRVVGVTPADASHRLASDSGYEPEAADLLTPDRRSRLSALPQDLLTTTGFVIQARKETELQPRRGLARDEQRRVG